MTDAGSVTAAAHGAFADGSRPGTGLGGPGTRTVCATPRNAVAAHGGHGNPGPPCGASGPEGPCADPLCQVRVRYLWIATGAMTAVMAPDHSRTIRASWATGPPFTRARAASARDDSGL